MDKIPLVDLQKNYKSIKKEALTKISNVLLKGNFILGQELGEFEEAFAKYCGIKYCIGVASGTDALLLSLRALGVGPGDEVITQANTFIATVLPIIYLGARPVLVDCHPDTYQIDPKLVEKAITKKTKVIIPVHLYGIPASMLEIMKIARRHKLFVLEDACQAHGSSINGKKCGSFGDIAAFSFYPGKNLGAGGDGGAIVTNNPRLEKNLRMMRDVGQSEKYKHDIIGYNSRLDTLQAAFLSVKLKRLDNWNNKRRKLAKLYDRLLSDLPVVTPPGPNGQQMVNYHLYVVRAKKRDGLLKFLRDNNVFAGMHYPIPVHRQKSIRGLNHKNGKFPITEQYSKEIISLPIYPEMTEKEVRYVSQLIHAFYQNGKN